MSSTIAPGARIIVRDAEWLVRRVDMVTDITKGIHCIGISEIVRGKEAIFFDSIEASYGRGGKGIEVLKPEETALVLDNSGGFKKSLLHIEAQLRQIPPTNEKLYIGHKAAMDVLDFQLEPAIQALKQVRQRILIADAVGLGKTLEAGILVSELIKRERGKRILVVTVKSMLTQFQKEWWSRFTIPLTRLDSVGINRIHNKIPSYHNPFNYYDKAIISVDTLKSDREYRNYLENAYWDIIVIDEAQHVADRGNNSMRSRLAKLLANRSDTLILLTATPHDGNASSCASIINMLDPVAITDPENYVFKSKNGLFIRRFKNDVIDQIQKSFPERNIQLITCPVSKIEDDSFRYLVDLQFSKIDQRNTGNVLFKTTLEKALFSSPSACIETIDNRIKNLNSTSIDEKSQHDIKALEGLKEIVSRIDKNAFSKYQALLNLLKDQDPHKGLAWNGTDKKDRLVIFTERIASLEYLKENLAKDLKLRPEQIAIIHGQLEDTILNEIVEKFGQEDSPIRLLISSDVGAEGINLHYLSHKMVHFDIPWSLMTFQQRNGRIDRYGQEQVPQIRYLLSLSQDPQVRDHSKILEILVKKEEQAAKNIGDPQAFIGVYDQIEEERYLSKIFEKNIKPEEFEKTLDDNLTKSLDLSVDLMALLFLAETTETAIETTITNYKQSSLSLFENDYNYCKTALEIFKLNPKYEIKYKSDDSQELIEITNLPEDLEHRYKFLPQEIRPEANNLKLSSKPQIIIEEINKSRKQDKTWPNVQYLWPLHPAVEWVNDRINALFSLHEAPVISIPKILANNEVVFIVSGLIPNLKGQPIIHKWVGVTFKNDQFHQIELFENLVIRLKLNRHNLTNQNTQINFDELKNLLKPAVDQVKNWINNECNEFEKITNKELNNKLKKLESLKQEHYQQLEIKFKDLPQQSVKDKQRQVIDKEINHFLKWVEDSLTLEKNPFIQIIAVLIGNQ